MPYFEFLHFHYCLANLKYIRLSARIHSNVDSMPLIGFDRGAVKLRAHMRYHYDVHSCGVSSSLCVWSRLTRTLNSTPYMCDENGKKNEIGNLPNQLIHSNRFRFVFFFSSSSILWRSKSLCTPCIVGWSSGGDGGGGTCLYLFLAIRVSNSLSLSHPSFSHSLLTDLRVVLEARNTHTNKRRIQQQKA